MEWGRSGIPLIAMWKVLVRESGAMTTSEVGVAGAANYDPYNSSFSYALTDVGAYGADSQSY